MTMILFYTWFGCVSIMPFTNDTTLLLITSNVYDQETMIILLINKLVKQEALLGTPFCLHITHVSMFPVDTILAWGVNIYHELGIW